MIQIFDNNERFPRHSTRLSNERFRIRNVAVAILRTFENAHYQYTRGMIEEMLWEPWTANIEYFCRGFGVRELWPELLLLLNREFRGYVEATLRRIEAEDAA